VATSYYPTPEQGKGHRKMQGRRASRGVLARAAAPAEVVLFEQAADAAVPRSRSVFDSGSRASGTARAMDLDVCAI